MKRTHYYRCNCCGYYGNCYAMWVVRRKRDGTYAWRQVIGVDGNRCTRRFVPTADSQRIDRLQALSRYRKARRYTVNDTD